MLARVLGASAAAGRWAVWDPWGGDCREGLRRGGMREEFTGWQKQWGCEEGEDQ